MTFRSLFSPAAIVALGTAFALPRNLSATEPVVLADFDTTCVETILKDCRVLSAGYLNRDTGDTIGTPFLAWQTQSGFTDEDGSLGGVVLLQHLDGGWTVFGTGFDGYRYEPPTLNQDGLLHVEGYTAGTGAFNADLVYRLDDTGMTWQKIDVDSWLASINDFLPPGLGIWKGVDYDFESAWRGYSASTSLWRSDDANCCATGGSAVIHFDLGKDSITVDTVDYTPPVKEKQGA